MFTQILLSTAAAATLLTATPTLAATRDASKEQCSCCSDGSAHDVDHPLREKQDASASGRSAQPSRAQESPDVSNQSWGG